jgi:hypothetical protein
MHIKKNVCVKIINLILEIIDTCAIRKDLQEFKIREISWFKNIQPAPTQKDPTCVKAIN